MTQKDCQHCLTLFVPKRKWQLFCTKSCAMKAKYIRDRAINKPKYDQYKADLKRFYGLSVQDFESMVHDQNNCCAICGVSALTFTGRKKRLCVDHCHTTGKIRGLLCEPCNTMLGMARDNTKILSKAIKYLRKT